MKPLLRWAGGKTRLLPEILARLPERIDTYHEPFVGGGAVFFALAEAKRFRTARLSDTNKDLVNFYRVLRDDPDLLLWALGSLRDRTTEADYYAVRSWYPDPYPYEIGKVERAGRFLYLNRTCFNGLHRVNKHGEFNVPWGRLAKPHFPTEEEIMRASRLLDGVEIREADATDAALAMCWPYGVTVYFDPPYVPLTETASFTAYSSPFGDAQQELLAHRFRVAAAKGFALLSNSDTPRVRELYAGHKIDRVEVRRSVGAAASSRVKVGEVLVTGVAS